MATIRAKRLAHFLEKKLDWTVFPESAECRKCGGKQFEGKFCMMCGGALAKDPSYKFWVYEEIEEALKYALKEDA